MEFALRERVILVVGPLSTTVQSLMSALTAEGADVALLDRDASKAEKFCSQLTDQREIKSQHGRAIAVNVDLSDPKKIQEAVGHVSHSFGGIDVLLDAQLWNEPTPIRLDGQEGLIDPAVWQKLIDCNLKSTIFLTQSVASFLKGRKKGRLVFLMNDAVLRGQPEDAMLAAVRSGLVGFSAAMSRQLLEHNVTSNVISLGLTEEYLLAHEPGVLIKEALTKLRVADPKTRITEPEKVANALLFLLGPSGAAVTGQVLRIA